MPYGALVRYGKRWRKKRLTRAAFARTAARFGTGYLSKGFMPTLASEAKRFINDLGSTITLGTTVNAANPFRYVLTTIPRNISGTDTNQTNRIGRKIFLKGVSVKIILSNTTAGLTSGVRLLIVQQRDPDDDIKSTIDVDAPITATGGIRVLYDKYLVLNQLTDANGGTSNRVLVKYIKVNKPMVFLGSANDGTDPATNSLVLYNLNADTNGHKISGGVTVHYRDYV